MPYAQSVEEALRIFERLQGTQEPMVMGDIKIVAEAPEDQAIINKVMSSIVQKVCGFRKFSEYAGSRPFEEFFRTIGVDRFTYANFEREHKETESILLFGP